MRYRDKELQVERERKTEAERERGGKNRSWGSQMERRRGNEEGEEWA